MSHQVSWNLDLFEVPSVEISQITILPQVRESSEFSNNLRLLVLSHSIAYQGTPAFYLEKAPSYSNFPTDSSVVMVFDYNHSFDTFQLDTSIFEIQRWTWIAEIQISNEIMNNFQRALALHSLYAFKQYNPVYFTTFIIIPGTPMLSEPFIYQKVPVRCGSSIRFRTLIQGSLDILLNYQIPASPGNFILLPPYEHLFNVVESTSNSMTLTYVDRTVRTLDPSEQPYVLITKPNVSLPNYFSNDDTSKSDPISSVCNFPPVDFMDYTIDDINNCFDEGINHSDVDDEQNTYFDFPDPTGKEMIDEQIADKEEKKWLSKYIGQNEPLFPSHRCDVTLIVASFLSFFRFDFGFSEVSPPVHGRVLGSYSPIQYTRLDIPKILVKCNGHPLEVPADKVIDQWEENQYLPLSGPKPGHFVVFCQDNMDHKAVELFFTQFCHIYALLGFGELSPFPRFEAFYYTHAENIVSEINEFFKTQPLSEYQQNQLLTFIVSQPIYDSSFNPHSVITYVRPGSIESASEKEIKTLAFVAYSRIRIFKPQPYGRINLSDHDTAFLFFGYKYQPPFFLPRTGTSMTLHLAYEPHTGKTAFVDDSGSILHCLTQYIPIEQLKEMALDAVHASKVADMNITITILGEGITEQLISEINEKFSVSFPNFMLFSVYPSPLVQVVFDEDFDDDAIIYSTLEQQWAGEFKPPLASCYVVSHEHPPYHVSVYTQGAWKSPETNIMDYVKQMSHLSWLSVKPGSEKRTISYPPHICALLRKSSMQTLVVNQFEFLPSTERI